MSDLIRREDVIEVLMETIAPTTLTLNTLVMRINSLPSAEAVSRKDYHNLLMALNDIDRALREYQAKEELPSVKPIQTRNCDGCDIFTMAEELAKASIDACADEIVRQIKDSRVECSNCKHHHTSEMYEYCDLIAVKGRRQRVMKYCSLGERR